MQRASGKLVSRTGNPIGHVTMYGKSKKNAQSRLKSWARRLGLGVADRSRKRNVEMGFYDASGFHRIRGSSDYSRARAGEGRARSRVARRTRARAHSRKARRARRSAIS